MVSWLVISDKMTCQNIQIGIQASRHVIMSDKKVLLLTENISYLHSHREKRL